MLCGVDMDNYKHWLIFVHVGYKLYNLGDHNHQDAVLEYNFKQQIIAIHLAHANCTLFCAPNAQKRTGSQQGKKTIFLDVS